MSEKVKIKIENDQEMEIDEDRKHEEPDIKVAIKTEESHDNEQEQETIPTKVEEHEPHNEADSNEQKEEQDEEPIDPNKINSLKSLGPFISSRDNDRNVTYMSDIPEVCKSQPCILGVDEAGRGPVLGPMVYGISFCPKESQKVLVDLGCADSKQLTEEKREIIFDDINRKEFARSCIGWAVELISPNVISTSMYRRTKCSLNEVSMTSAIGLINLAIDAGVNIAEVYVDTVGPPEKYQAKLQELFPHFKITVAKKADSTYPIVSAASICAKVTRDNALKVWRFPEGLKVTYKEFGSGYPGDPNTKRFLANNIDLFFGFPRLVRFSWSTAETILAEKAYSLEFDEQENEKNKKTASGSGSGTIKMTSFFKGKTKTGQLKRQTCRFLKERCLEGVSNF